MRLQDIRIGRYDYCPTVANKLTSQEDRTRIRKLFGISHAALFCNPRHEDSCARYFQQMHKREGGDRLTREESRKACAKIRRRGMISMRGTGSYYALPQDAYQVPNPGTPGWQLAPVPGWGINPFVAGPRRVAVHGVGELTTVTPPEKLFTEKYKVQIGIVGGFIAGIGVSWLYGKMR